MARPKTKRAKVEATPADRLNFAHSYKELHALISSYDEDEKCMEQAKALMDMLPFISNARKEVHGKKVS